MSLEIKESGRFFRSRAFPTLGRAQFLNLTTFRTSGEGVTTPVLYAGLGDEIVVMTDAASHKVRRLTADPHVEVAPTLPNGRALHAAAGGRARRLEGADARAAEVALRRRYPLRMRILARAWRGRDMTFVAIAPVPAASEVATP